MSTAERKPVDVLEVMRSDAKNARYERVRFLGFHAAREAAEESDAAIAAVEELIEAADQTLGEFDIWDDDLEEETSEASISRNNAVRAYRRLKEALAACRGGAPA